MAGLLKIERLGGFAGFGLPSGRVRSIGQLDLSALPSHLRAAIDALFDRPPAPQHMPDAFRYKLTRTTPSGENTIEVPESAVPQAVADAVKDELL